MPYLNTFCFLQFLFFFFLTSILVILQLWKRVDWHKYLMLQKTIRKQNNCISGLLHCIDNLHLQVTFNILGDMCLGYLKEKESKMKV